MIQVESAIILCFYDLFRNVMDLTCQLIRIIHVPPRGVDLLKFITYPKRFASILNFEFANFLFKLHDLLIIIIHD